MCTTLGKVSLALVVEMTLHNDYFVAVELAVIVIDKTREFEH